MRKIKWYMVLSIVATILSIVACLLVIARIEPITIDWLGVLAGVLSLLVTALIGWNIYTFIDIKGAEKKLEKFREEFEKKTESTCAEVRSDLRAEILNTVPLLIRIMERDASRPLVDSLSACFKAFHVADSGSIAKIIAREYILGGLMLCQNELEESKAKKLIKELSNEISIEELEDFFHEFLSYSDEDKHQSYPGIQNVLFELMKAHT